MSTRFMAVYLTVAAFGPTCCEALREHGAIADPAPLAVAVALVFWFWLEPSLR